MSITSPKLRCVGEKLLGYDIAKSNLVAGRDGFRTAVLFQPWVNWVAANTERSPIWLIFKSASGSAQLQRANW